MSTPDNIPADVREAIEKAWEDAFDAYCKECGDSSAHQAACISIRSALAPFFAAKDAEIERLQRLNIDAVKVIDARGEEIEELQSKLQDASTRGALLALDAYQKDVDDLKRQLAAAQARYGKQCEGTQSRISEIVSLRQQLAEAQRDTARLMWAFRNGHLPQFSGPEDMDAHMSEDEQ